MTPDGGAPHVLVLAAGRGRRMRRGCKPLTPVFFRPMLHRALDLAFEIPRRSLSVAAGAEIGAVRESCVPYRGVRFFEQKDPTGPADAVRAAEPLLGRESGDVLILNGDSVLLTARTLRAVVAAHAAASADATVGRAAPAGPLDRAWIPEGAETPLDLRAVGGAIFCFKIAELYRTLASAGAASRGREALLGDAVEALRARGGTVAEVLFEDRAEGLDIDDPRDLWRVETVLRERFNGELMRGGALLRDPRTTVIDPRSRIAPGAAIEGGTILINSAVEEGAFIESGCRIVDSDVGPGCVVRQGSRLEGCRVGADGRIGPYAFLRDAYLGRGVVVGCGFVASGDDGAAARRRIVIEDGVFIGGGSQAIAPVRLGAGSFVATGTSVTEDAPPDSFVISRGRQVTKPGYSRRHPRPASESTSP